MPRPRIMLRSPSPSEAAPKSGASGAHHGRHQLPGVRRVGVRMMAAEVLERLAVHHRARWRTEPLLEDRLRVGPGDRRHAVVADAKATLEQRRDALEIEQLRHQLLVVGDRIDDLDRGIAEPGLAQSSRGRGPPRPGSGTHRICCVRAIDRLGDLLGRRPAVPDVVLDAEVAVRAAGIVAGRQDQPAERLRACGSRQDAAGVDSSPPWPTTIRPKPLAAAIFRMICTAVRLW